MNMFKKRYMQIKGDAKKFATAKNVPESSYPLFSIGLLVFYCSTFLSTLCLYFLASIESFANAPSTLFTTVMLNSILPAWWIGLFFGLGKYFFYARILMVYFITKTTASLITKLDMYWWRKYRKQSPLTEMIFKMQNGKNRLSKTSQALIVIAVATVVYFLFLHDDMMRIFSEQIQQNGDGIN